MPVIIIGAQTENLGCARLVPGMGLQAPSESQVLNREARALESIEN